MVKYEYGGGVMRYMFVHPVDGRLCVINRAGLRIDRQVEFDASSVKYSRTEASVGYLIVDDSAGKYTLATLDGVFCFAADQHMNVFPSDPRFRFHALSPDLSWRVGCELEFFLLPFNGDADNGHYAAWDRGSSIVDAIVDVLNRNGIQVHGWHNEVARNQYEISLAHCAPRVMADRIVLATIIIESIARQHKVIADFSPKPFNECNGNGRHLHLSYEVLDDTGSPAKYIPATVAEYQMLAKYLAGKYDDIRGILASGEGSNHRLTRGFEAPVEGSYGIGDRTQMVRLIDPDGNNPHIELRLGDATFQPHRDLYKLLSLIEVGYFGKSS